MPTTELLKAKLKSREKVEKYTGVITGDLIKHEEKWKLHTQKNTTLGLLMEILALIVLEKRGTKWPNMVYYN